MFNVLGLLLIVIHISGFLIYSKRVQTLYCESSNSMIANSILNYFIKASLLVYNCIEIWDVSQHLSYVYDGILLETRLARKLNNLPISGIKSDALAVSRALFNEIIICFTTGKLLYMGIQNFYTCIDRPGFAHVLYMDDDRKKTKPHQPFLTSAHCTIVKYFYVGEQNVMSFDGILSLYTIQSTLNVISLPVLADIWVFANGNQTASPFSHPYIVTTQNNCNIYHSISRTQKLSQNYQDATQIVPTAFAMRHVQPLGLEDDH